MQQTERTEGRKLNKGEYHRRKGRRAKGKVEFEDMRPKRKGAVHRPGRHQPPHPTPPPTATLSVTHPCRLLSPNPLNASSATRPPTDKRANAHKNTATSRKVSTGEVQSFDQLPAPITRAKIAGMQLSSIEKQRKMGIGLSSGHKKSPTSSMQALIRRMHPPQASLQLSQASPQPLQSTHACRLCAEIKSMEGVSGVHQREANHTTDQQNQPKQFMP